MKKVYYMEFGQYIRNLRKEKGLSARELSRLTGISQAYLSQLETGKYNNPTKKVVIDLSQGLGVSRVEPLRKAGYLTDEDYQNIAKLKITSEAFQGYNPDKHFIPNNRNLYKLMNDDDPIYFKKEELTDEEKKELLTFADYLINKRNNQLQGR